MEPSPEVARARMRCVPVGADYLEALKQASALYASADATALAPGPGAAETLRDMLARGDFAVRGETRRSDYKLSPEPAHSFTIICFHAMNCEWSDSLGQDSFLSMLHTHLRQEFDGETIAVQYLCPQAGCGLERQEISEICRRAVPTAMRAALLLRAVGGRWYTYTRCARKRRRNDGVYRQRADHDDITRSMYEAELAYSLRVIENEAAYLRDKFPRSTGYDRILLVGESQGGTIVSALTLRLPSPPLAAVIIHGIIMEQELLKREVTGLRVLSDSLVIFAASWYDAVYPSGIVTEQAARLNRLGLRTHVFWDTEPHSGANRAGCAEALEMLEKRFTEVSVRG